MRKFVASPVTAMCVHWLAGTTPAAVSHRVVQTVATRLRQDSRPSLLRNSVSQDVLSALVARKTCCQVPPVRFGLIHTASVKGALNRPAPNEVEARIVTRLLAKARAFPDWPSTQVGPVCR